MALANIVVQKQGDSFAVYKDLESCGLMAAQLFELTTLVTSLIIHSNQELYALLLPYIVALKRLIELSSSQVEVIKVQAAHPNPDLSTVHKLARAAIRARPRRLSSKCSGL